MELPPELLKIQYLGFFVAFAVGLTQLVKDHFVIVTALYVRLLAAGSLVGSAVLYRFIQPEWQPFYLLLLAAVALPGVVGLVKEIKRD